ncbi:hypothetical protein RCL_jg1093.t1 [Rhizophagus clarus]|uniref:Uncharacterized protein n=1 Tax=Rhizophagus clarus TaxID=94130 RepID=A0A8H3M9P0_9GLOM|nr:hypothetical protein RCL_jg1093.t1 [Rhizophagus clarus]
MVEIFINNFFFILGNFENLFQNFKDISRTSLLNFQEHFFKNFFFGLSGKGEGRGDFFQERLIKIFRR